MSRIIIAIHGLGNKPSKKILERWWKRSIREGLNALGVRRTLFNFRMIYWADILHEHPLDPGVTDKEDSRYLEEPYQRSTNKQRPPISWWRRKLLAFAERKLDRIFLNRDMTPKLSGLTNSLMRRYFRDLEMYYSDTPGKDGLLEPLPRDIIRKRLIETLHKCRKKKIMLIAHSMGSIVAYDVLAMNLPQIRVDTFVTIGSPLGLPVVVSRMHKEQIRTNPQDTVLRTPQCIHGSWYNFSDSADNVALDHTLNDDYAPNARGVRAVDISVENDYEIKGRPNPHKSYGYLRTPEVAALIDRFLSARDETLLQRIINFFRGWFEDIRYLLFKR